MAFNNRFASPGVVSALAFSFFTSLSFAQNQNLLRNSEFEQCDSENWVVGWERYQHAGDRVYRYTCDTTTKKEGKSSARLDQTGPQVFGSFLQRLPVGSLQGRRVKLSAWVKAEKIGEEGGGFYIRTERSGAILKTNSVSARTKGSHDWKLLSFVFEVPKEATDIEVGGMIEDLGSVWIDSMSLALTDDPETVVPIPTPKVVIGWDKPKQDAKPRSERRRAAEQEKKE
jgi:hypothetical protein